MKILILEGLHEDNKGKRMQWRLKRTNLKVGDRVVLDCHDWKVVKVVAEKRKPKRFLSVYYGREGGDYTGWIQGYINKDGEIVIDRGGYKKKEVKKVSRPYFEYEVVKVKNKKKENYCWQCGIKMLFKHHYCPYCGNRLKKEKPKGNWVNGENLDKIKFPCFCSYSDGEGSERKKGLLSMNRGYYYIADLTNQKKEQEDVSQKCDDLAEFVIFNNVKILKGKIIIWEEIIK